MTTTSAPATIMAKHQIAESGAVLGRAFFDDPLLSYILPDDARRARPLTWFMTRGAHYGHKYGEVHTTPGAVAGTAVWLPPGEPAVTAARMLTTGLLMAPLHFGMGALGRFLGATGFYEKLHKQYAPEPHWYLMVLGVDPPRQGQGVGGALIAPMLERADASGVPCYLETNKARNVLFYQRHGFAVCEEGVMPGDGPQYWTMKRAARR